MSKNYAITRIKKYAHLGSTSYLVNHHLRLVPVSNANPRPKRPNEVLLQKDDVLGFIAETPKGSKRNACRLVDIVFGGSEFKNKKHLEAWTKATLEFAKKEFGEANIALAVVHHDETTPHMHVMVKPVNPKTQKLGAGYWFDGALKMKSYQDRYHKALEPLGFERGDPSKRAHHKSLKAFYRDLSLAEAEYGKFVKNLVGVANEIKNVSLWDRFNPLNLKTRVMDQLKGIAQASKTILMAKQVLNTEKVFKDNEKLTEEVKNLEHKLQHLTGMDNPTWVDIQPLAEVINQALNQPVQEGPTDPIPPPKTPAAKWAEPQKKGTPRI